MWWLVRVWVPIAIAVTGVSAIAFAGIQQNYRQSLNDPQIQMAEDGAARLAAGGVPADVVPRGTLIDANGSLTPWIAVFDGSGKALESTASIGTTSLSLPSGIFASEGRIRRVRMKIVSRGRIATVCDRPWSLCMCLKRISTSRQDETCERSSRGSGSSSSR